MPAGLYLGDPSHHHSFPTVPASHQHYDPGLGLPLVHQVHNGLDATSHLLCCMPMVVGPHPDHHDLWKEGWEAAVKRQAKGALIPHPSTTHLGPDVFQFPILQPPQYMLCAVTTNAKIECMQGRKELPPDLWMTSDVIIGLSPHSVWALTKCHYGKALLYGRSLVKLALSKSQ